ncbi:MAG TPA: DHA2 family efflux MFS transporter permease subunit [Terracidiphilus sp.]|jgi:MFS transporter, DHA2 family, multidrug resistance protein
MSEREAVFEPERTKEHLQNSAPFNVSGGSVNPWIIGISVMLATFMEVLDTAIASVALPYIAGSLSASTDEATWVLTSYLVANAIVLPASNWCALKFGRKRFLLTCVAIFTASSFACGAAPTLGLMLLARILQGAGGGALQPLSQSILLESFPPEKRGVAMSLFGFGVVCAPVLGPTLGGWLTDAYSWRYAFYINIPVGILAILMISRFVHDPPHMKGGKSSSFDSIGLGTLVVWTGCLQVILDKGQEDDWFGATWIRWAAVLLVVSFVWFVWHSWRAENPLVNLRVLKDRNFALGCVLILLFGISIYSTVTVLPLFYQELLGYTAFTAGVVVAPRGIGSILAMPLIAYLSEKIDSRYLLTFGFVLFALTTLYMGGITTEISPWTLLAPILITGFGVGFIFVPITTQAYGTLRREQIGGASGLYNLMRNIGGSIGISVCSTLLTRRGAAHQSELTNYVPLSGQQFEAGLATRMHALTPHFGPGHTRFPAEVQMYSELQYQATDWAFVDVFRWLALLCLVGAVLVWFFKRVERGRPAAGAH